ncbi:Oxysterol-binding protein-domain-containing protein [Syncephalis plumigaleata]|nr:Oxysterol-binding protein-domain-containing protein [Syncephalis plumigaleata]
MDYTADPALYNYKLVEALHAGDKDMLKRLINAQASTNESSALASGAASIRSHNENYRQSPLHIAVQIVPLDLVKYLLSFNQLDVNQRDADGNTPLHLAAKTGRVDVVRELLDRKDVDISLRNDEDQMAVDIARGVDIVDMIVEYRNDIVNQIAPHVHQAASKGDLEQVKRLLEDPRAGALDINHQNPMTGRTALHEATVAGNADLVRYLLRKGADPFIRDKKNKTALELTKAEAIKSALKESFNDAVLATIPGEVPRMQGSLYKWTNFASGYKLRYFVLENGILSYYKNQEDAGNACRGSINIGTANIWMDSGDKTRFDILGKGSVRYHLRSEHATEAKRWIMALTQSKQWVQESLALPNTPISSNTSTPAVGTLRPLHAVQQSHGISTPLNAPMHSTNLGIDMAVTESDERRRQQAAQRISPNVERTPSIISTGGGSITGVDMETESVQDSSQAMGKSASTPDILVTRSPQSDDSAFASNNGGEPPYGDQLNLTFQAATVQLDVQQQLLHSVEATVASIVGADTDIARRCDMVSKGLSNSLEALRRLLESAKHMSEDREVYWRARCDAEAERQRLWEASLKQVATEREEMFETLTSVKDIARKSGVFEVSAAINGPVIERECEEFEDEDEFFDATEEGFIFEEVLSGEVSTVTSPRARRSLSLSHPSIGELRGKAAEGETGVSADAIVEALTEEIETDNELALSFRGYPMNASDFRTELPPPDNAAPSISIWSVLKNSIGKDLTKISMPVIFNEPTSMLQRMCEDIEYIDLLDTAVCQRGSAERMLYVAAFAISNYSSTLGRIAKPFNPLLGETFEYVRPDKNYRYISEQVSHHPPISACHCDSPNYSFFAEVNVRSKFMGNTLEMHPSGVSHLVLKVPKEYVQDDATNEEDNNGGDTTDKRSVDTEGATAGRVDEHYSWTKCVTAVNNLILGRLTIEHYGDMPITNHLTGETCMLTFKQRGWRGKDEHVIEGSLKDRHGRVLYELLGKWSDKFIARRVADDDFHLSAPDADGASMGSGGTRGRNFILWRKNPAPETPRPFNLTEFAAGLNDCPDTLRPYLAPTDSRIRPDQHALERGEWDLASQEKTRLEEKQRAKRRERELEDDASGHGTHQARWFRHDIEPDTGAGYWRFTNEYWRERAKAAKAVDAGQQPQWKDVEDIF